MLEDRDAPYVYDYLFGDPLQRRRAELRLFKKYNRRLIDKIQKDWGVPRETAEDCMQEVWMLALSNLHTFQHKSKLSTWLYRVAYNYSVSFFRHNKNRNTLETIHKDLETEQRDDVTAQFTSFNEIHLYADYTDEEKTDFIDEGHGAPFTGITEEMENIVIKELWDMCSRLPRRKKEIFTLDMRGMNGKQTAHELGILPEAVSMQKQYIKQRIRERIANARIDN